MADLAPPPALKEWSVIVDALMTGEQILDLRKGGLREDGRHFGVRSDRCWLYPTGEHQRADLLKPAYASWVDRPVAPIGGPIRISAWAAITDVAELREPDALEALDSKLIWSLDYAASRLKWKRRDPLHLLVMRVHRLLEPITVDWSDDYQGCTSWVDLHGLPTDPHEVASEPALSDGAFDAKRQGVIDALAAVGVATRSL